MKNVTLRQLKVFLSVSRLLSFTQAANELSLSVPAISQQIKELETDIGLKLFIRNGRKKTELTTAGEYLTEYARRVLLTIKEADLMMKQLQGRGDESLTIGLVSTAKYMVPKMLSDFKSEYGELRVRLEVRNRNQLIELLNEGIIDIAIMGTPPKELDARAEAFAIHPHAFIASPHHWLSNKSEIHPSALNKIEIISRENGSGTRNLMERFFRDYSIKPSITMEMSSNESIKQAVIANLGISFVSLHTVGPDLLRGDIKILDIEETPIDRMWYLVALNNQQVSRAAQAFRYFMLERGEHLVANMFNYLSHYKASLN
jgi:LysR family transcriptional regulator, low CO2-responsive transcriptional regulator